MASMLLGGNSSPQKWENRNLGKFSSRAQMEDSPLPEYESPPIIETVLGVQFVRLDGFTNAHLGAFWASLDRSEWPETSNAPSLEPQFERFEETAWASFGSRFTLTNDPSSRLQIRNADRNRMIQVQSNRLHFNWLGKDGDPYPSYEVVKDGFDRTYQMFAEFANKEGFGEIRPNQWEITYVNHILRGTVWQTPADWSRFFCLLGDVPGGSDVVAEGFAGRWRFVIPEKKGRLHVEWQQGAKDVEDGDKQQMVRLTFTARGPVSDDEREQVTFSTGLDLGREAIVRSFKRFMSDEANRRWGLKDVTG
jgi:uncharacterized protein (TIGR04255 family)